MHNNDYDKKDISKYFAQFTVDDINNKKRALKNIEEDLQKIREDNLYLYSPYLLQFQREAFFELLVSIYYELNYVVERESVKDKIK